METLNWRSILSTHDHSAIVVRHGETEWNVQNRVATTTEVDLTERGKRQAREAGLALSGVAIDRVITSPRQRTLDTARELLRSTTFTGEIEIDARLAEPPAGPFEGESFPELWGGVHPLSEDFAAYVRETNPVVPEGAEDPVEAGRKVAELLDELGNSPGNYVLVSHGGLTRIAAAAFLGLNPRLALRMKIDNCHALALKWYAKPPHQVLGINVPPNTGEARPPRRLIDVAVEAGAIEATPEEYAAEAGSTRVSFVPKKRDG